MFRVMPKMHSLVGFFVKMNDKKIF
ncbi:hypothetical protein YERSI8AC_60052 [Enterobacterales bacterium 8AC]|nr:hypothetical protein YERSI8AC_60052 [Enterobacterales bacterium 8AC]